jgi:hypothetical protein
LVVALVEGQEVAAALVVEQEEVVALVEEVD